MALPLLSLLDLRNDQRMLYESLEEEKRADALLTNACQGRGEPRLGFSVRNQSCFILVGRFLSSNHIPSRRVGGGCRCGTILNKTLRLAPI